MAERPSIDVYPVGWLSAILRSWSGLRHAPRNRWFHTISPLRAQWRYLVGRARDRNWRAIKNSFNGYLAEPRAFPAGLTRCGSGWTRKRALRSLARHARKAANRG